MNKVFFHLVDFGNRRSKEKRSGGSNHTMRQLFLAILLLIPSADRKAYHGSHKDTVQIQAKIAQCRLNVNWDIRHRDVVYLDDDDYGLTGEPSVLMLSSNGMYAKLKGVGLWGRNEIPCEFTVELFKNWKHDRFQSIWTAGVKLQIVDKLGKQLMKVEGPFNADSHKMNLMIVPYREPRKAD